jgi:hypothetical protein
MHSEKMRSKFKSTTLIMFLTVVIVKQKMKLEQTHYEILQI